MRTRRCPPPKGEYLEHRTSVAVRFSEVDVLQMVWHGHYLTYFEDARVGFGKVFGIDYTDIRNAGLLAPIVHISCHYLQPARYTDDLTVLARLYRRETATIEFYYEVRRAPGDELLAAGTSTQAFADFSGQLILTMPEFLRQFYARWEGSFTSTDA